MTTKDELFEAFGKQLIERVRDNQIHYIEMFLEQQAPLSKKYKNELDAMSPEQIEMIKAFAAQWVDGVIHDFLFLLEDGKLDDSKLVKLRIESEDTVLEDIRRASRGDMQGYIFIWAEQYSKERLSDFL
jgi:hypothetical protein